MRVEVILGTRPQIIKSAPLVEALFANGLECSIVNTGQHYDYEMNRAFFSELKLPQPTLDIGVGQGSPSKQISKIIASLDSHFTKSRPDLVVVPGDTNSALAAGIACSKSRVLMAHLESGCRSNDLAMSEEVNRRVLDHISQVLLCPTELCVSNLRAEHAIAPVVENVGDTMYDSILRCMPSIDASRATVRYGLRTGSYAFMTLHRAENVDDAGSLSSILSAVGSLGIPVIFSVHPRTRSRIAQLNISVPPILTLVDPLPYFDTLKLVKDSRIVITDSGGLQKEAFWLRRPSLVARDVTEWSEIVAAGAAILVGSQPKRITQGYRMALQAKDALFNHAPLIFGDGRAGVRAVRVLSRYLGRKRKK